MVHHPCHRGRRLPRHQAQCAVGTLPQLVNWSLNRHQVPLARQAPTPSLSPIHTISSGAPSAISLDEP
jgi:hypothetical protein